MCAAALALAVWPGALLAADGPDTLSLRVEAGLSTDVTNEVYYEDAFIDDTFLGTRRVSTPETRIAAVVLSTLNGTRNAQASRFQVQNELRIGDKLQRGTLSALLHEAPGRDWQVALHPHVEFRRDQTFDRDLEEWRGSASGRIRRTLSEGSTFADLRLRGEFLRTQGAGADFVPDRNAGQLALGLDHAPLFGHEWHAGYRLDARQFPDSTVRDHLEHGFDGRVRFASAGNHWLALDATVSRRSTLEAAPTTRDNFWQQWLFADAGVRLAERWSIRSRAEFEGFQYDVQDSTVYFDYRIVRARIGPRYEQLEGWSFGAGPAGELLDSPLRPEEDYAEIGGYLEVEYFGAGSWWSVTPALGWREYSDDSADPEGLDLHTSYAFYDLQLIGDQRLPGGLRVRALASARVELHADTINDATSLYFSLDVRRLF